MQIAGTANTVANAVSRLDMDPTFMVDNNFQEHLGQSDYIHCQHLNMSMLLSQLMVDSSDLSVGVYSKGPSMQ